MSQQHQRSGSKAHTHNEPAPQRSGIHRDWRFWAIAGVMLLAMLLYVMTVEESVIPGENPANAQPMPADISGE